MGRLQDFWNWFSTTALIGGTALGIGSYLDRCSEGQSPAREAAYQFFGRGTPEAAAPAEIVGQAAPTGTSIPAATDIQVLPDFVGPCQPDYSVVSSGAGAAGTQSEAPVIEAPLETGCNPISAKRGDLLVYRGHEDSVWQMWDGAIIEAVDFWNHQFSQYKDLPNWEPLDPNVVKAMFIYECRNHPEAFKHLPAQFGNQGDPGFTVSRDGGEFMIPEGGFADLKPYKPVPRRSRMGKNRKGEPVKVYYWDFNEPGIVPPELSIMYGVRWLWQKNAALGFTTTENGPVNSYVVRRGDTLWDIAKKLKTTPVTIARYTGWIDDPYMELPESSIGKTLQYREARREAAPSGFDGWSTAIQEYNGGGDPNYGKGVDDMFRNPVRTGGQDGPAATTGPSSSYMEPPFGFRGDFRDLLSRYSHLSSAPRYPSI